MKHLNLIFLLILSTPCFSAQAQNIAVVDMMKINQELQLEQKIRSQVDKKFAKQITAFKKMHSEHDEMVKNLQKNMNVMADAKKKELARKIESLESQMKLDTKALDQDMKTAFIQHRDHVMMQIQNSINKVATEHKYDLVLQRGAAVFHAEKVDISQFIIEDMTKNPIKMSL